jgi:hypothetical protein
MALPDMVVLNVIMINLSNACAIRYLDKLNNFNIEYYYKFLFKKLNLMK